MRVPALYGRWGRDGAQAYVMAPSAACQISDSDVCRVCGSEAERGDMKQHLVTIAETSAIVGAVLYGLGWLFFVRFFGAFGATPELVGVDFPFIVVRVAAVLVLALIGLAVIIGVSVQHPKMRVLSVSIAEGTITLNQRTFLVSFLAIQLTVASVLALTILFARPWRLGIPSGPLVTVASVVVGLIILYYEAAGLLRMLGYRGNEDTIRVQRPVVAGVFALGLAMALIISAVTLAAIAVDRVKNGDNVVVMGVRVQAAKVSSANAKALLPAPLRDSHCLFLLGQHDGSFVLYDVMNSDLVLVSTEIIVAQIDVGSGCELAQTVATVGA
jgi:hypothetical protein